MFIDNACLFASLFPGVLALKEFPRNPLCGQCIKKKEFHAKTPGPEGAKDLRLQQMDLTARQKTVALLQSASGRKQAQCQQPQCGRLWNAARLCNPRREDDAVSAGVRGGRVDFDDGIERRGGSPIRVADVCDHLYRVR